MLKSLKRIVDQKLIFLEAYLKSPSPYTVLFIPHPVKHYNVGMLRELPKFNRVIAIGPRRLVRAIRRLIATSLSLKDNVVVHANGPIDGCVFLRQGLDRLLVTMHDFLGHLEVLSKDNIVDRPLLHIKLRELKALIELQEHGVPIVAISNYAAKKLREYYGIKAYRIIYHGVLEEFRARAPKTFPYREVKLLSVVHLHPVDEPLLVPKALRLLSQDLRGKVRVLIRGEGPLKGRLIKELINVGVKFKLLPRVPFEAMPLIYRMADIYVHTSHREGFGFPVVEAMASGLPLIVPANSAAEELTGGAALTFTPSNEYDLADKVEALLTEPELYNRVASMCYTRSFQYDWRKTVMEYTELYKRLIS
jgi:glycosyltransferase involved in cell wall biosynthesis